MTNTTQSSRQTPLQSPAQSPTQSLRLRVVAVDTFEVPFKLRLPFRFGVITVTEGLQAIARVRVRREDGREAFGYAAEALGAKWFDKNPALTDEQNCHQLRRSVELTRDAYLAAAPMTAFALHADHYRPLLAAGAAQALPPLVMSYGPALLDRAVLDALCRIEGVSFWHAMRHNLPGMVAHAIAPDLAGFTIEPFLRALQPLTTVAARHTVGLVDPIVASDQAAGTRVQDGLPETLEEVITFYGNRHFKLKVSGDVRADVDRLVRIAQVLDTIRDPIVVTLDGNEQFEDAESAAALWRAMADHPSLQRLCQSTVLIEQPIKRQYALARPVDALAQWRPVIIDESDGDMDAFVQAIARGYTGVSTKVCKGLYKSVLNLARCVQHNAAARPGAPALFMSAEDLTTQPGVSVQQDLALVSLLGITHVERNAHHFIDGFAQRPQAEARAYLAAHPDLYAQSNDRVRLRIESGQLQIGSLSAAGFGSSVSPLVDGLAPMPRAAWPV